MFKSVKRIVAKLPPIQKILLERDSLKEINSSLQSRLNDIISKNSSLKERNKQLLKDIKIYTKFVPPGHFYSPIPGKEDIKKIKKTPAMEKEIFGINLRKKEQYQLLIRLHKNYAKLVFPEGKKTKQRYYYDNPHYSYCDAVFLFLMIMDLKPKNILEVGSGYSSCALLDTNDLFFGGGINLEFIEPYPELLNTLISTKEQKQYKINTSRLQDVPLEKFKKLLPNDILFIDSTHVSKLNSDVNYLIHTILPNLNKGVYIHIHDIFWPFEYPKKWLQQGRAWNESYILRAFLQYNQTFKIVLFNDYIQKTYPEFLNKNFPIVNKNRGGSIWIKKIK